MHADSTSMLLALAFLTSWPAGTHCVRSDGVVDAGHRMPSAEYRRPEMRRAYLYMPTGNFFVFGTSS